MDITQQLERNREEILKRWFECAIDSYPEDTARIFKKSKNKFDNPVGSATMQSLQDTLKLILNMTAKLDFQDYSANKVDANQNVIENALDPIIRIRAVQNFSASQAVAFVFELKTIVKSVVQELHDPNDPLDLEEFGYITFDHTVDLVALAAFNRFMKCRENIFLLKATEAKRRIHSAFERAGLVTELTEDQLLGSNNS
ncbi:MAG: RsbRD N-terminal domain-containing protein [Desulfamplus sp.]|nr:RsbRD N-terminal domain-containing protein [Desulfamplus sp.]